MKTVVFSVPDMSCNHCEMTIKQALGLVVGVKNTTIDLKKKLVTSQFDETATNENTLSEAIARAGYAVTGIA
jgi:copper chaperone